MKYLVSAEEMKRYDDYTIQHIHIPALVLMERAALSAYELICRKLGRKPCSTDTCYVLAGLGNNGADGLALARMLAADGAYVEVCCIGTHATPQWKTQREILNHFHVSHIDQPSQLKYDIIVDALFGVGLTRDLSGEYALAVQKLNDLIGWKLALDIPSGICADDGRVCGEAVKADATVTFAFSKRGLVLYPGCTYAGEITIADIGIDKQSFSGNEPQWFAYDEPVADLLPSRDGAGNKGTFGNVLLIAGSHKMSGAAILAAKAIYRLGAGMVKLVTTSDNREILQSTVPEALYDDTTDLSAILKIWADVIVIGPGLGTDERALELLKQVADSKLPVVVDADALNLLSRNEELLGQFIDSTSNREVILTPHVVELSRLTKVSVDNLKDDLASYAKAFAEKTNMIIVAKDARSFICRANGPTCVNLTGNSGMATAGSGDVLAGVIGSLLAQGMDGFRAASVGAYIHGRAGDEAAKVIGEHGCMAGDLTLHL